MNSSPLVSCLCVTRNRVGMLRRAIACYQRQTYARRELLVLYESDDAATRDFMACLDDSSIRALEVAAEPKLSLGELRNHAVASSCGGLVAQWDDDDWYSPARLAEQIGAISGSGRPACVLARWIIFDVSRQLAMVSNRRTWEGSLVANRDLMPAYAALPRGEDTPLIARLLDEGNLVFLDRPDLYVYVVHGANTWDRGHSETNLFPYATPLAPGVSARIAARLAQDLQDR